MEEQKIKHIESGKVKMEPVVTSKGNEADVEASLSDELQKWTKDKLIQQVLQMNRQLYNQGNYVNRLRGQINEMQNYFSNKRMEYLFKVIEITQKSSASEYACFAKEFVEECISEIQETLHVPEQAKTDDDSKKE